MIPEFDPRGLLSLPADGLPFATSLDEIERRLVIDLGSPEWRVRLFSGLKVVHATVASLVPSARWWLWGCFVSNHPEPLDGKHQVISALTVLPDVEFHDLGDREPALVTFLRVAEQTYKVDAGIVIEFEPGDDRNLETMDAMEGKWRPRAQRGVADHSTRLLEPAGYVEVLP